MVVGEELLGVSGGSAGGETVTELRVFADEAAERIVLGAVMLSASAGDDVIDVLTSGDFYRPAHASIYAALTGALAVGEPTDPVAIVHRLAESGEPDRSGGAAYLLELVQSVPTVAQVGHYARIVAGWAARRRALEAGSRIVSLAGDLSRDVPDMIDVAQQTLHAATSGDRSGAKTPGALLDPTLKMLIDDDGSQAGLSTGLGVLDDAIGGLRPGQLMIVGARPGVGKSFLLLGLCRSASVHRGIPSALWSLEMSEDEVMMRLLSAECDVDLTRLIKRTLRPDDIERLTTRSGRVRKAPMMIDDARPMTVSGIRSRARRIQQTHGLDLIVVDYLQLLNSSRRHDSRVTEVGEMSRDLKILAGDLGVPVVVAAQLNRNPESRRDGRPQLSDLRESGSIEADADVVILLHRDDMTDPNHARAGEIDLIVAKNRSGPGGTVTALAQLHRARVTDFAPSDLSTYDRRQR